MSALEVTFKKNQIKVMSPIFFEMHGYISNELISIQLNVLFHDKIKNVTFIENVTEGNYSKDKLEKFRGVLPNQDK